MRWIIVFYVKQKCKINSSFNPLKSFLPPTVVQLCFNILPNALLCLVGFQVLTKRWSLSSPRLDDERHGTRLLWFELINSNINCSFYRRKCIFWSYIGSPNLHFVSITLNNNSFLLQKFYFSVRKLWYQLRTLKDDQYSALSRQTLTLRWKTLRIEGSRFVSMIATFLSTCFCWPKLLSWSWWSTACMCCPAPWWWSWCWGLGRRWRASSVWRPSWSGLWWGPRAGPGTCSRWPSESSDWRHSWAPAAGSQN